MHSTLFFHRIMRFILAHSILIPCTVFYQLADSLHLVSLRSRLERFTTSMQDEYCGQENHRFLPLSCSYSHDPSGNQLAVSDEEGHISLYNNTQHALEDGPTAIWKAHNNAIFDIAWTMDNAHLISGSGDQASVVWDVETMQHTSLFRYHQSSVKSVDANPMHKNIFATSGRDGCIFVFDTRVDNFPINTFMNAHVPKSEMTIKTTKKRKSDLMNRQMSQSFTVTSVLFLDQNQLISTGAADGLVKIWDMRKNCDAQDFPIPISSSRPINNGKRSFGLSALSIDPLKRSIFVTSMDNSIYQFNTLNLNIPIKRFTAESFSCSSFYIRNTVSPDGRFLCSGSTNSELHLWEIEGPLTEPILFSSHVNEVTGVCWSPNFNQIASCSDDRTLKVWRLDEANKTKIESNWIQNYMIKKGTLSQNRSPPSTPALIVGEGNDENREPNVQEPPILSQYPIHQPLQSTSSLASSSNSKKPTRKLKKQKPKALQKGSQSKCITDYFQTPSKEL